MCSYLNKYSYYTYQELIMCRGYSCTYVPDICENADGSSMDRCKVS